MKYTPPHFPLENGRKVKVYWAPQTDSLYQLPGHKNFSLNDFSFHLVTKDMELKPNCGSDRAWVWNVSADYADEEPRKETLAIKFGNAESMLNL